MRLPWSGPRHTPRHAARAAANQWTGSLAEAYTKFFATSYQNKNPTVGENALQSVAFHAACDLMASLASELPLDVWRSNSSGRPVKVNTPGYLLDPAGDGYGLEDWIYQCMMSWLLRGNLYGHVLEKSEYGVLRQVDLWHPDSVSATLVKGQPLWRVDGDEIPAAKVLHRRVNSIPGVLLGLSPVAAHADTLGLSLSATSFGRSWFQDGAHPGGILYNSESDLTTDQVTTAKQRFLAALNGTREPVALGKGWKWEQLQINPEESQFLETQGFTAAECARILGPGVAEVLGYETGGSMTYATVVDRDLSLLKYSANRWLRRMERLLTDFTPKPQYVRYNRDAFLEINVLDRFRKHQIALQSKIMTPNEVRDIENLDPEPWGNEPLSGAAPPTETKPPTDPTGDTE